MIYCITIIKIIDKKNHLKYYKRQPEEKEIKSI